MSTKKNAKVCKIHTGRKPPKRRYDAKKARMKRAAKKLGRFLAVFGPQSRSRSVTNYDPPHDWPPYGGPCWQEAWAEMNTFEALLQALARWLSALAGGPYMPPEQIAALEQAYMDAMAAYNAAWQAMEDCVNGYPV